MNELFEEELAGAHGEEHGPPPWILGHRGTPREAPENTLSGLRRALERGLDGFEYDLRACATGEAVLMHDATLERTTDGTGPIAARGLPELFGIDAGSWFERRFRGEPVPLFEEALELVAAPGESPPMHMIELKERGLVAHVADKLRELAPTTSVRVASFLHDVVLEARDVGLPAMLLADHAEEDDRRFVRDERLAAHGVGPGGWRTPAGKEDWSFCERWSWSVDDPSDLLEACREPLFGINTNEPYRATSVRALVRLAPNDHGPHPLRPPLLQVVPEGLSAEERARGEWYGAWDTAAHVRNPFPFPVRVACGVFLRGGAFEVEGLPVALDLEPGDEARVPFRMVGGSRGPGADPLFAALYRWRQGPGRAGGRLLLDAGLHRVRRVLADGLAQRLELLRERPGDPPVTMTLRRDRRDLVLSIENPGDLRAPHAIARLGREVARGGSGLRLRLPEDFDASPAGVPFSCGIEGEQSGSTVLRRWAGGLPEGLGHGSPGRLIPLAGA